MLITYSLIRGHFRYMSLLVGQLWIWIPNYSSFFLHPTSLQKVPLKKSMDFSVKTVIELTLRPQCKTFRRLESD